ncbi:hypothetical protein K488DRAFT_87919 [Vararia minispora EC-137]|uniref:Uncharacterized protein n=1 Tax=Vararia minispora EC-137 TaxID=1314806 RepID=A0ACB8QEP3_9AGAM|nr:hypothetical protein K488DRAFT_87919 [Vararia minispora EC-137]
MCFFLIISAYRPPIQPADEVIRKFRWLRETTYWVDGVLDDLEDKRTGLETVLQWVVDDNPEVVKGVRNGSAEKDVTIDDRRVQSDHPSPPQTPSLVLRLNNKTRGRGETSNSRADYYSSTYYSGPRRGVRPRALAREGKDAQTALTSISGYGAIFATLGAISFFGASTAWTSVFSANHGDAVLLCWSASLFAISVVSAGSAGAIASSDQIDFERDTVPRRTFGMFAVLSAVLVLGGMFLMSAAAFNLDPIPDAFDARQKRLFRAAGAVSIGVSLALVFVAVGVRVAYSHNGTVFGWKIRPFKAKE